MDFLFVFILIRYHFTESISDSVSDSVSDSDSDSDADAEFSLLFSSLNGRIEALMLLRTWMML